MQKEICVRIEDTIHKFVDEFVDILKSKGVDSKLIDEAISEMKTTTKSTKSDDSDEEIQQKFKIVLCYSKTNNVLYGPFSSKKYIKLKTDFLSKKNSGFRNSPKLKVGEGYLFDNSKLKALEDYMTKNKIPYEKELNKKSENTKRNDTKEKSKEKSNGQKEKPKNVKEEIDDVKIINDSDSDYESDEERIDLTSSVTNL